MKYTPAKWVIVEIKTPKETLYKVLGSWYGGYAGSDSWRLNSGIEYTYQSGIKNDTAWYVKGFSGSIYVCHPEAYGMSIYTASVAFEWLKNDSCRVLSRKEGMECLKGMNNNGKKAKTS